MDTHKYLPVNHWLILAICWGTLIGCKTTTPSGITNPLDFTGDLIGELPDNADQGPADTTKPKSKKSKRKSKKSTARKMDAAVKTKKRVIDSKVKQASFSEFGRPDIHADLGGNPPSNNNRSEVPSLRLASPKQEPPKELAKMALPKYRLEPPDVLLIDVLRLVPKSPYTIQPFDVLEIIAPGSNPDFPLADFFQVEPNGNVNLGALYGTVKIAGKTVREAQDAIVRELAGELSVPQVSVSLAQIAGQQTIAGEHLVGPDGYLNLGTYGSVYINGMTLEEAREAIEMHLSRFLEEPKISLDVFAYNSKVYYVIIEGAGYGDSVVRLPATGNETVLDAMSMIGGTQRQSNKRKMWIARPAPSGVGCDQILPIDWVAITKGGSTQTNYQILPGDRIFIAEDKFILLDGTLAKFTAPFERILGFSMLGGQTVQLLQRFPEGRYMPY